jgi:putative polyhydroxyalkanoate system protein
VSNIKIRRAHALSPKQARDAAEKIAAKLSEAFDMEFDWDDEVLRFQRSGVEGHMLLGHKEVVINAQLGFLLSLMQPKIEQAIH